MKKILAVTLVVILALCLLTACGKDSGGSSAPPVSPDSGNSTNSPAQQDAEIIKSSELITQGAAAQLLGEELTVDYLDKIEKMSPGSVKTKYNSHSVYITIALYQNAALDLSDPTHKGLLDSGGISSYNETIRKDREKKEGAVKIEGIGDWAIITGLDKTHPTADIGHGDYSISIDIVGTPKGSAFSAEEKAAWRTEKLTEAGTLAVERLKTIIG